MSEYVSTASLESRERVEGKCSIGGIDTLAVHDSRVGDSVAKCQVR